MKRTFKTLAIAILMLTASGQAAMAYEESFNGAEFEQIWKSTDVLATPTYANQGYGVNDEFIIHNNIEGKLMFHDRNSFLPEKEIELQARIGMGISHDDAGNWIVRLLNQNNKMQRTKPELWLINGNDPDQRTQIYLPESILPDSHIITGNCYQYMGTASGDIFSEEGGQFVFTAGKENTTDGIYVLRFKNGQLDEENSFRAGFERVGGGTDLDEMFFAKETYIHTWHAADGQLHYLYVTRSENPIDMVLDEENHMFRGVFIDLKNNTMPTGYVAGQSNGFNMFSMGGKNYMVFPASPNFLDGFFVAEVNVEDGTFILKAYHSNDFPKYDEDGNKIDYPYEPAANNWLNAEPIDDHSCYIYQYFIWGYFAKYRFTDEPNETPLEFIVNEGEENSTYTIADDIIGIYIAEKEPSRLYAKDLGRHRFPSVKGEEQVDYLKDFAHVQADEWDQSNWVLLDFGSPEEAQKYLSASAKSVIRGGTLTGVLTDKLNPVMTVISSEEPEQWTDYLENYYITCNFMDPLSQIGKQGNDFFFVEPKPQEYVKVCWATYDGHESYHFSIPESTDDVNGHNLKGGFNVDWSLYPGNYLDDFIEGHTYDFHAIVRYTAEHPHEATGPTSAPRRDGETGEIREGDYLVFPLEGGDDAISTAISEAWIDIHPVDVTYVNVMGMASKTPFDGLNIVVTRYSNGTMTTTKVFR